MDNEGGSLYLLDVVIVEAKVLLGIKYFQLKMTLSARIKVDQCAEVVSPWQRKDLHGSQLRL
jgi:hypothetical protein